MNDPSEEKESDLPRLDYEIKHSTYCASCDVGEKYCKCDNKNICDLWQIHFNHEFVIEIWNEHYLLDHELISGSLYTYPVEDVELVLKSEEHVKNDTWVCTLSFENERTYLKIHNKQ